MQCPTLTPAAGDKAPRRSRSPLVCLGLIGITTLLMSACGGDSDSDGAAEAGTGAASFESAEVTAAMRAFVHQFGTGISPLESGMGLSSSYVLNGRDAATGGAGSGELRPLSSSPQTLKPYRTTACPAGGNVTVNDSAGTATISFASCIIPVGGDLKTYQGSATVSGDRSRVQLATDLSVTSPGVALFFQMTGVDIQSGDGCNSTVRAEDASFSGRISGRAFSERWRQLTSVMTGDPATACEWTFSGRFTSDGSLAVGSGAVPSGNYDLYARTLSPLVYVGRAAGDAIMLPFGGEVQIDVVGGPRVLLRFADGGVYVTVGSDAPVLVPYADFVGRAREG